MATKTFQALRSCPTLGLSFGQTGEVDLDIIPADVIAQLAAGGTIAEVKPPKAKTPPAPAEPAPQP